jgi:hypothetical protein
VLDYTPVLRAELGLDDGRSLGSLSPPAGVAPLSIAAFHRRADGICRTAIAAAKGMLPREHALMVPFKSLGRGAVEAGEAKPALVAMGRWLENAPYRLALDQLHKLAALTPPARDAADYRRYLTLNAKAGEWALAEARVFQLGASKVPNSDGHKSEEAQQKRERQSLAASLGIPVCEKDVNGAGAGGAPT